MNVCRAGRSHRTCRPASSQKRLAGLLPGPQKPGSRRCFSWKEGSRGGQQPEESVPGREWVLGNGKSKGRKPPAGERAADRGQEAPTLEHTAPGGPASQGSRSAEPRPRAPRLAVRTDPARGARIGAEAGRSPPTRTWGPGTWPRARRGATRGQA